MKLSDLGAGAQQLLEAFATQLVENDPEFPLPSDRSVGAGEIPWDGPGLYVYLGATHGGQPGRPETTSVPSAHATVFVVTFYAQLIRAVSSFGYWAGDNVDLPPSSILGGEGIRAVSDAGALIAAASQIKQSGAIAKRPTGFVVGAINPIGPQGGLAAVRLQLDISIDE